MVNGKRKAEAGAHPSEPVRKKIFASVGKQHKHVKTEVQLKLDSWLKKGEKTAAHVMANDYYGKCLQVPQKMPDGANPKKWTPGGKVLDVITLDDEKNTG